MVPITGNLLEQLKPWITLNKNGKTVISHPGLLIWLNAVHPGWRVAAGDIHTLDTGLLAETEDGASIQKVTSYVVSAHVLNDRGEVVSTGFSSEYRAFKLSVLKNPYSTDWPTLLQAEAEERALYNIGISEVFLAMAVSLNRDLQKTVGVLADAKKSHPPTLAVSDSSDDSAVETLYSEVCAKLDGYIRGMDFKAWVLKTWNYRWETCPATIKDHIVRIMNQQLEK